jgi:hypothetical protein
VSHSDTSYVPRRMRALHRATQHPTSGPGLLVRPALLCAALPASRHVGQAVFREGRWVWLIPLQWLGALDVSDSVAPGN